jgi:hypothetical protein
MNSKVTELASYRNCVERIQANWPAFAERRKARLAQQERHGSAAEKVAESILEDLFTSVLDWTLSDLNNQIGYADLLLTRLGIKYLLIEVKRPSALAWHRRSVDQALEQARRYADQQMVKCIGVSDGAMLYAADIVHGGTKDRLYVSLDGANAPEALWWLSVHGVYREIEELPQPTAALPETPPRKQSDVIPPPGEVLHPKYHLPARCFGYVGNAVDHSTWKLPYLLADGTIDAKRLPKAIGAILSNYRGAKVSGIPEAAIPDVLVRLAQAASRIGKLPQQGGETAAIYEQLVEALAQLGREGDVRLS